MRTAGSDTAAASCGVKTCHQTSLCYHFTVDRFQSADQSQAAAYLTIQPTEIRSVHFELKKGLRLQNSECVLHYSNSGGRKWFHWENHCGGLSVVTVLQQICESPQCSDVIYLLWYCRFIHCSRTTESRLSVCGGLTLWVKLILTVSTAFSQAETLHCAAAFP